MRSWNLPALGLATLLLACPCRTAAAATFLAGAHAVDITPQRLPIITSGGFLAATAEKLSGTLGARAIALDDGQSRIILAVADSLMMPRELLDRVKDAASRKTGIPTSRMLISATHTHSAPPVMGALGTDNNPEYAGLVEARLVEAIEGAVRNLSPAAAGWIVVDASGHTNNRRWILRPDKMRKDPFGDLTVRANMHPGYQNPDFVGPSGPVDPALSVLALRSRAGRPIALLANYSMHYVGAGGKTVSPDYFGAFVEKIQQLAGAQEGPRPFVAVMSQGTSGDLHWMDYSRPRKEMSIETYGDAIAGIVHEAWRGIEYTESATLAMAETTLRIRRRTPPPERLAWARQIHAAMAGAPPRNQQEVYAREQILIAAEPERELKLQAVRIGNLGIAAIPNEVFAITGLKIKAQSPLPATFNIELANGAEGYIPPPEQHALGGYTTWPARTAGLLPEAEPRIVEAVLGLLEKAAGRPRRPVADPGGPYVKAVLAGGPAAYWRGCEFAGPAAKDVSGNGNNAVYEGGVAFYLDGPLPRFRAPHFAGGGLRGVVKNLGGLYSLSMWFYNGMPPDARPVAGTLYSTGPGGERLILTGTAASPGKLSFTSLGATVAGSTSIEPRTWHHIVVVRERGFVTVYLDGNRTPEIAGQLQAPASAPAGIWVAGDDPVASFEGRISEIAAFNRSLTAREAARQYAAASQ